VKRAPEPPIITIDRILARHGLTRTPKVNAYLFATINTIASGTTREAMDRRQTLRIAAGIPGPIDMEILAVLQADCDA
jgi:hypothetical protein